MGISCCYKESKVLSTINEKMDAFYFRFMKLDYIKKKINEFNEKKEKNYFTFWELTKICGINAELEFQNKYWELVYVMYGKENISGVLFIFILLCKGADEQVFSFLKHYLSNYVNKSQDENKKLIMNLSDFEKILRTYFCCLTIVPYQSCIYFKYLTKDSDYDKISKRFNENNISEYTTNVLKNYVKKNYYVNVEDFLENNLDLLKNDKRIRKDIMNYKKDKKSKNIHPLGDDDFIIDKNEEKQALTPKYKEDKKFLFVCNSDK